MVMLFLCILHFRIPVIDVEDRRQTMVFDVFTAAMFFLFSDCFIRLGGRIL